MLYDHIRLLQKKLNSYASTKELVFNDKIFHNTLGKNFNLNSIINYLEDLSGEGSSNYSYSFIFNSLFDIKHILGQTIKSVKFIKEIQ